MGLSQNQLVTAQKIRNIRQGEYVLYHTSSGTLVTEDSDPSIKALFKTAWEADQYNNAVCVQQKRGKVFDYYVVGVSPSAKQTFKRLEKRR